MKRMIGIVFAMIFLGGCSSPPPIHYPDGQNRIPINKPNNNSEN